ncbi:restriction endonuclease [Chloroflexota bacterium]
MGQEPKWRRFEKLVAHVQKELAPNAVVTHNDKIKGYDSDRLRQIDVTVKQKIGQYEMLIAIDCKDYRVPVDVKDTEEFIGLIKDIRANQRCYGSCQWLYGYSKTYWRESRLELISFD